MNHDRWIWELLGIARTDDAQAIKRAYARQLKAIDSEADPGAFIALRQARDAALAFAVGKAAAPPPPPSIEWVPSPRDADPPPPGPPPPVRDEEPGPEPPPLPPIPTIVARSALPELEAADLERVDALLFGGAEPEYPDELEVVTARILAHPATERIDVARWLEGWMAERIAQGMPRSDPMIEPAIAHFRWDDESAGLNRPPVIDWVLKRREDKAFEAELIQAESPYVRLIKFLRRENGKAPNRLVEWWRGVRIEYLFAYLRQLNPTVMTRFDPDVVARWDSHIAAEHEAGGLKAKIREWRRKRVWDNGLWFRRPVTPLQMIGIALMPYVFAWFLLGRGYSMAARVLAFGWMAFVIVAVLATPDPPSRPKAKTTVASASLYGGPPVIPAYGSLEADVDPILLWMTGGRVRVKDLGERYSSLHYPLESAWRSAGQRNSLAGPFAEEIAATIADHTERSVYYAPYDYQAEYWRLRADMAIHARTESDEACAAVLRGDSRAPVRYPEALEMRRKAFRAKAVFQPSFGSFGERSPGKSLTVPPAIANAAARNANMDVNALGSALLGRGTAAQYCDARIGLIEALLAAPEEKALPVMQQLAVGF